MADDSEQFDIVRAVYSKCASSAIVMALCFNLLLLWLILKKTPDTMRIYSKLLMAPCFLDMLFAVITFLAQPMPVVDRGFHAVVQNGFFRKSATFYNYTANVLWFQLLLLFLCCSTVQFLFRHYMVISDGNIPKRLKWLTALVLSLLLVAHVVLHYWSDFPYTEYEPEMLELAKQVEMTIGLRDIRFSSFTPARSYPWLFHCAVMVALFTICYCIIGVSYLGTRKFISRAYADNAPPHSSSTDHQLDFASLRKNQRMQEYNHMLTKALIVQAILPTMDALEMGFQSVLPVFLPTTRTVHVVMFLALPLYFIPVLNPLATILLVRPYRRALFRMIRNKVVVIRRSLVHTHHSVSAVAN